MFAIRDFAGAEHMLFERPTRTLAFGNGKEGMGAWDGYIAAPVSHGGAVQKTFEPFVREFHAVVFFLPGARAPRGFVDFLGFDQGQGILEHHGMAVN